MKAKTFLELATLSATLYQISKETHLMDKLESLTEQGKDKINEFMKESVLDENGNELEFMDRMALKAKEVRDELEMKIGEMVASLYEKMNIAHVDKINKLQEQITQMGKDLALAEARIKQLEKKKDN